MKVELVLPAEARVGQGSMSGRLLLEVAGGRRTASDRRVADGSIFGDTVLVKH